MALGWFRSAAFEESPLEVPEGCFEETKTTGGTPPQLRASQKRGEPKWWGFIISGPSLVSGIGEEASGLPALEKSL